MTSYCSSDLLANGAALPRYNERLKCGACLERGQYVLQEWQPTRTDRKRNRSDQGICIKHQHCVVALALSQHKSSISPARLTSNTSRALNILQRVTRLTPDVTVIYCANPVMTLRVASQHDEYVLTQATTTYVVNSKNCVKMPKLMH